MNALTQKKATVIIGVVGLAGAAYAIYRLIDGLLNPNRGTAFEGTGPIGTLGNVVDKTLGGAPSAVGGAIGRKLYDLIHSSEEIDDITYLFTIIPGDKKGAVNSHDVQSNGRFEYNGKTYVLKIDEDGKKFAVATEPGVDGKW